MGEYPNHIEIAQKLLEQQAEINRLKKENGILQNACNKIIQDSKTSADIKRVAIDALAQVMASETIAKARSANRDVARSDDRLPEYDLWNRRATSGSQDR